MAINENKLLHILEENSDLPNEDLAAIFGVAPEEIAAKKKELTDKGILLGDHALVNWEKTDSEEEVQVLIQVSAKPEKDSGYDKIAAKIARYPEVKNLYLISGTSEFLVEIHKKSMREVADFVGRKLAPIEGVQATVTCVMLKKYKLNGMNLMEGKVEDDRQLVTP